MASNNVVRYIDYPNNIDIHFQLGRILPAEPQFLPTRFLSPLSQLRDVFSIRISTSGVLQVQFIGTSQMVIVEAVASPSAQGSIHQRSSCTRSQE